METIRAVIVEDEKPAARRLHRMLAKLDMEVVVCLHSVEEAIKWFTENPAPDLLFLDVQLSDGISFEIFDAVQIKAPIIFTTAYDEYALQAFKHNSIDYLLKPIDEEELCTAVEKFKKTTRSHQDIPDLRQLKLLLNPGHQYRTRFTLEIGQHLKIISVDQICCFFSENKGTYVRTSEKRSYLMEGSLEALEPELDPSIFFRVNRKYIVKLESIKDIISYANQRLEVILHDFNEDQIIVSRDRVKDFRRWISG